MDWSVTREVCPGESHSVTMQTLSTPVAVTSQTPPTPAAGGRGLSLGAIAMETDEGQLDIDLTRKSRRLNLTSSNVRDILHEVITHEHVVAMMKTAISTTLDLPMFEPKMTRSRLKQSFPQPPQFVDIDLEDDEDSSDEEYCPDDDEEEEEEEEEFFLSDTDTLTSSPRMHQNTMAPFRNQEPLQTGSGHLTETGSSSSAAEKIAFVERLDAVEAELDYCPAYHYQQSSERKTSPVSDLSAPPSAPPSAEGCLAYRTRSKLPLVDVPLGQLEAELLAPDITADMYEGGAKDHHWTEWLQSLMAPDCGVDEAEDEDDPEYDFNQDLPEPDLEDYRTDRAVQITKKEVNQLLEELCLTLQEEELQEEEVSLSGVKVPSTPSSRSQLPLAANTLARRSQMLSKRSEMLQERKVLQDATNRIHGNKGTLATPPNTSIMVPLDPDGPALHLSPTLHLGPTHRMQLQQQIQQHVQLLTEVHLLSRRIDALQHQADTTKHYLEELDQFVRRREEVCLHSAFRVCNLQGALDLLQEVQQEEERPAAPAAPSRRRWLPTMTLATNSLAFPLLPAEAAWLFATRPVFMYPELLPVCSLDPTMHCKNLRRSYTAGEEGLTALALKHFEGVLQRDELICSYLFCKNLWTFRKLISDCTGTRASPHNPVKMYLQQKVVPHLPTACSRVLAAEQRPPVDASCSGEPNWLKNSRQIIQKTRLADGYFPGHLPLDVTLRLHPYWLKRASRPRSHPHKRLITLAHNGGLLPLARAPSDGQLDSQSITTLSDWSPASEPQALAPPSFHPDPSHPAVPCLSIGQNMLPSSSFLLPPSSHPIMPCSPALIKPHYFLLHMLLPAPAAAPPPDSSLLAGGVHLLTSKQEEQGQEGRCRGEGGRETEGGEGGPEGGGAGGEEGGAGEIGGGEEVAGPGGGEEGGGAGEGGEEERGGGGGEDNQERDGEEEREEDDEEKEEEQDRLGEEEEEEEEEDFDDLTQDEDEEEVMSSASEESVLSVPELQETMKQLTWLAAERRLCGDGDSEEDHSPTSQEEEEEDEEVQKEELLEGRSLKAGLEEELLCGEATPRGGRKCPGRGRGRSRPMGGLRRNRQERHRKDGTKLLLLLDDNIVENDPHRESKDAAFAQTYLNRVREALQEEPSQVEQFVSLLKQFEEVGDGQEVTPLFRKLRCILGERTDLLRDFAAFLHPEQALECGLWEEQQAFERSRRFLRQLEISFGENPSQYQKIIKALQAGPDLNPGAIYELKAQMDVLLKGHTHLQAEFWVFFDELRPPPARPGQFEEAHWPEEGGGGPDWVEGVGQVSAGRARGDFEEVTLPELEEEEEGLKHRPMNGRRQKRALGVDYKVCDWPCLCHDAKMRRHRRKGCPRCHDNKGSEGAIKNLDLYSHLGSAHVKPGQDSPPAEPSASWEALLPLPEDKEEEEEEEEPNRQKGEEPPMKKRRQQETPGSSSVNASSCHSSPSSALPPPRQALPPLDSPVCAKNISLTPSGEKVILWTREADRVILTKCQQEGANQNTFQAVSSLLGNKTPTEVSRRFHDLMRLFRTAARHTSSEDEAPPTEETKEQKEGKASIQPVEELLL